MAYRFGTVEFRRIHWPFGYARFDASVVEFGSWLPPLGTVARIRREDVRCVDLAWVPAPLLPGSVPIPSFRSLDEGYFFGWRLRRSRFVADLVEFGWPVTAASVPRGGEFWRHRTWIRPRSG